MVQPDWALIDALRNQAIRWTAEVSRLRDEYADELRQAQQAGKDGRWFSGLQTTKNNTGEQATARAEATMFATLLHAELTYWQLKREELT